MAILSLVARLVPQAVLDLMLRSRRLASILTRILPRTSRVVRIASGPLAGVPLEIHPATEKAFWAGAWEPEIAAILVRESGGFAWDVGAHIGYFTLLLAKGCERVLAVEASPAMAARLRRNVRLNNARVEVVEAAVTDRVGVVSLELAAETGMSRVSGQGGVRDTEITGSVEVAATTLDALLAEYGAPDLVKIDIEGAELAALRAGADFLAGARTVLCDLHGDDALAGVPPIFRAAGYDVAFVNSSCLLARREGTR